MNSQELNDALIALGETPEQVYANLKAKGITGRPNSCSACPIANYLTKVAGTSILVGESVADNTHMNTTIPIVAKLPKPVKKFIDAFDSRLAFQDLRSY
jgi:hypothetical protein